MIIWFGAHRVIGKGFMSSITPHHLIEVNAYITQVFPVSADKE